MRLGWHSPAGVPDPPSATGISELVLEVADLDAAPHFYGELLVFEETRSNSVPTASTRSSRIRHRHFPLARSLETLVQRVESGESEDGLDSKASGLRLVFNVRMFLAEEELERRKGNWTAARNGAGSCAPFCSSSEMFDEDWRSAGQ